MGWWKGRGEGRRGIEEIRGDERGKDPQWLVHTPMSEILKNTFIAELICLAGAVTQMFAPGGKHPRAATVLILTYKMASCFCYDNLELLAVINCDKQSKP